ncbi:MAG: exonuclease domain-containing protein [Bacillota bacterium]
MRRDPDTYEVPDYIAFDLETTGLSPDDDEILEVAMVRFESGKPVERWSTLLNPGRKVPLKVLRLTHIDESDLRESPVFSEVREHIEKFRRNLPLVGHNSSFDSAFLSRKIDGFPGVPVYDTLELSRIAVPGFMTYKLTDLARAMGVPLNAAHRAYDDAEVSGVIFAILQERIRLLSRSAREKVASVMGGGWEPRRLFAFDRSAPPMLPLAMELPPDASPSRETSGPDPKGACDKVSEGLASRLADLLDSMPARCQVVSAPPTRDAARAVARAAADHAASRQEKVLLLGFPESALSNTVLPEAVPEDYLCLWRFNAAMQLAEEGAYAEMDVEERRFLAALAVWADGTSAGRLGEIQLTGPGYGVAAELSCPPDMHCRAHCPMVGQCHYLSAISGTSQAGARSLSLARAFGWNESLAAAAGVRRVLVWGAHDIHKIWQYSEERTDLALLHSSLAGAGLLAAVPSLGCLRNLAAADARLGVASAETRRVAGEVASEARAAAAELRRAMRARLEPATSLESTHLQSWDDPPLISRGLHAVERAVRALESFASPSEGRLALVEAAYGGDGRGPYLVERSVWPGMDAFRTLESKFGAVLLFSGVAREAVRTEGGRRLFGTDSSEPSLDLWEAPRSDSGLVLWTADEKCSAVGPVFTGYLAALIRGLAERLRKGLLVLFPSRALIKDVYGALAPVLEEEGILVYAQSIDGGRRVTEHLLDEDTVVLATLGGTVGEEEPVPSCLVVAKVPFPPPNPVDDARRKELAKAGADGFAEVNVRPASLSIMDYAARMSAAGGRRALVLADPRLSPGQSRWAGEFLKPFDGIPRECGPLRYVVEKVSAHVRVEKID